MERYAFIVVMGNNLFGLVVIILVVVGITPSPNPAVLLLIFSAALFLAHPVLAYLADIHKGGEVGEDGLG